MVTRSAPPVRCSPPSSFTPCAGTASSAASSRSASAADKASLWPSKHCTETSRQRSSSMPLAKIHVVEGRYDEARIAKVSGAVQAALMNILRVPPEDFYQLIFEFP